MAKPKKTLIDGAVAYYEFDSVLKEKDKADVAMMKNLDIFLGKLNGYKRGSTAITMILIMYDMDTIFLRAKSVTAILPLARIATFWKLLNGYIETGRSKNAVLEEGRRLVAQLTSGFDERFNEMQKVKDSRMMITSDGKHDTSMYNDYVNYHDNYIRRVVNRMEMQAYIFGRSINLMLHTIMETPDNAKSFIPRVMVSYRYVNKTKFRIKTVINGQDKSFSFNIPELRPIYLADEKYKMNAKNLIVQDLVNLDKLNPVRKRFNKYDKDKIASETYTRMLFTVFVTLYLQLYVYMHKSFEITSPAVSAMYRAYMQKVGLLPPPVARKESNLVKQLRAKQDVIEAITIDTIRFAFREINLTDQVQENKRNIQERVKEIVEEGQREDFSDRKVFFIVPASYLEIPKYLTDNNIVAVVESMLDQQ